MPMAMSALPDQKSACQMITCKEGSATKETTVQMVKKLLAQLANLQQLKVLPSASIALQAIIVP